jgi:hypothetical protein
MQKNSSGTASGANNDGNLDTTPLAIELHQRAFTSSRSTTLHTRNALGNTQHATVNAASTPPSGGEHGPSPTPLK